MSEKQVVTMKMAKASKQDIDAAADLAGILGNVDKGYYPTAPDSDDADEPTFFDADDPEHLRAFYDRVKGCLDAAPGGLFRVVWGFRTLLRNDVVDPDLDHLALHPRITEALARKPVDTMSLAYPPEMTPALRQVLSKMCFQLGSFAHVFRAAGADIKPRAEDEQAYCLHWLIKHVLLHGDAWAEHAEADIVAAQAKAQGAPAMSFDYIRSYYGVDAKRGQRVTAYGKPGVITGADGQYLKIRLDGQKHSNNYHPTDGIEYTPAAE